MFLEIQQLSDIETMSDSFLADLRSRYGLFQHFIEGEYEEEALELQMSPVTIKQEDISDCLMSHDEESEEVYHDDDDSDKAQPKPAVRSRNYQKRKLAKTENEKLYEFKCHVCFEEFPKMQLLSVHCRSTHQTNPQVLCWCGTLLSTWKRLMAHKSKHTKESDEYNCSRCNISYKTKSAFDKHVNAKHGPDAVKFVCSQCGKQFKERQILKNHERVHLPDELKLKVSCGYCAKKFVNGHCLKIHIARIHEKVALHTCELCGKGCITKSDLKWHMVSSQSIRQFEICFIGS